MRIHGFQWPDDMTELERTYIAEIERASRDIAERFTSGRFHDFASEFPSRFAPLYPPAVASFCNKLRPAIREVARRDLGVAMCDVFIRFTWTQAERQYREASRRAREDQERRERERAARRVASMPERVYGRIIDCVYYEDSTDGSRTEIRIEGEQTGREWEAELGRGVERRFASAMRLNEVRVCVSLVQERGRWVATLIEALEPPPALAAAVQAQGFDVRLLSDQQGGRSLGLSTAVEANASRALAELEAAQARMLLDIMPDTARTTLGQSYALSQVEEGRGRPVGASQAGAAANPFVIVRYGVVMGTSTYDDFVSIRRDTDGAIVNHRVARDARPLVVGDVVTLTDYDCVHGVDLRHESMEFRREVLGEFRPPRPTGGPYWESVPMPGRENPRWPLAAAVAGTSHAADAASYAWRNLPRGRASMTADQWGNERDELGTCRMCKADDSMWCDSVVHANVARISRWVGDPLWRYQDVSIEVLISSANALGRLLRICVTIAQAAARARAYAGVWFAIAEAVSRAWAAQPTLLELDIAAAPFGVDVDPPEDAATVRVKLLEL